MGKDLSHIPKTRVAQARTVASSGTIWELKSLVFLTIKKRDTKYISPSDNDDDHHSDTPGAIAPPERSPVQEGKYPIPEDSRYTNRSSKGNPTKW